jgi:hypothetical protein
MSSKKERIAKLEAIVVDLCEKNNELNDAINMILRDVYDLQQFKRFVELSQTRRRDTLPKSISRECIT